MQKNTEYPIFARIELHERRIKMADEVRLIDAVALEHIIQE